MSWQVDQAARVRMQIRVVRVVFRSEMARMDRWNLSGPIRQDFMRALKSRSLQLLQSARTTLNGDSPEHPELLRELDRARAEISAGS
jgi:hypothetical protein